MGVVEGLGGGGGRRGSGGSVFVTTARVCGSVTAPIATSVCGSLVPQSYFGQREAGNRAEVGAVTQLWDFFVSHSGCNKTILLHQIT